MATRVMQGRPWEARRMSVNDVLVGGVASGLLAGAAMVAFATAFAGDVPASRPLALPAGALVGRDALEGDADVLLAGAMVWAVVSALLGVGFAGMVPRDFPLGAASMLGVGYAFFVMVFMATLILPAVNPLMLEQMPAMGGTWVIAYGVFGAALGATPAIRRRLAGRALAA